MSRRFILIHIFFKNVEAIPSEPTALKQTTGLQVITGSPWFTTQALERELCAGPLALLERFPHLQNTDRLQHGCGDEVRPQMKILHE